MRKILAIILALLIALCAWACGNIVEEEVIVTEEVFYGNEIIEQDYGIAIASNYTSEMFEVEAVWTNFNEDYEIFENLFDIIVFQNDVPLFPSMNSENMFHIISSGETITVMLQYNLIDTSPITVELRKNASNDLLWTYTYDLMATG